MKIQLGYTNKAKTRWNIEPPNFYLNVLDSKKILLFEKISFISVLVLDIINKL